MRLIYALLPTSILNYTARGQAKDPLTFSSILKEGIYLNFQQFKNNSPVLLDSIITKAERTDPDFMKNVIAKKNVTYRDGHEPAKTISTLSLWGYSRNGTLFIRVQDNFNPVTEAGTISYFEATLTVNTNRIETRKLILDFNTGEITDFTEGNIKKLLKQDWRLYNEFEKLSGSLKKEKLILYLRKYNVKHPIYFPAE